MYCTRCGQPLANGAQFCIGCGSPAMPATATAPAFCTGCGASLPQGGRFCPTCGRPTVQPAGNAASTGQQQWAPGSAVAYATQQQAGAWARATAFLSNRGWSQLVVCALVVVIIVDVVAIFSDIAELNLISRMLNGEFVSLGEAESSDNRQATMGMIQLVLLVGTGILFLTWMYRAYKNLRAFNVCGLQYSPGWAVGGWFVPVLCLWRPYQVMSEIWKASSPSSLAAGDEGWQRESTSPLLGWWWAAWLVGGFVGAFLLRLVFRDAQDLETLQMRSIGYLVGDGIDIVAAILAIVVVMQITSRQEEKNRALGGETAQGERLAAPPLGAPVWNGAESAVRATKSTALLPPEAAATSPPVQRGYCERCGQELGVNEKMMGLTAHQRCPTPASEAPTSALPTEAVETTKSTTSPGPDAAVARPSITRGYCNVCGQELGVNEKTMGLIAHRTCPMPVAEAPAVAPAQASQVSCVECGTSIPASSRFCHKCGSEVVASAE
jgi:hypothetical protein